jgi:hypothetical protein
MLSTLFLYHFTTWKFVKMCFSMNFGAELFMINLFFFHLLFLHIYSVIYIFIVKSLIGHIDLMFQACKGFCSVYSTRISSVPVAEVPSLLSSRTKPFEIARGTWGRMKNGNYKGDLAQVQYI